ncbi:MAG TPA: multifunctional oxoglutarate decarboxylase/oxoglutarate dehydrogenase thiamine pyrophosphate-binding subunit/dihydrolipoyllysine-residue succinyltransferase subunit [Actinomycetota bacterium]|nr:multifunctional oxoglutarate decarboxylase/oxoglutarate dehydrogenase thiamine pyrophosphate-binding subunit/dihydrolipoyllysine-residue succinyltransferase subunit [Actinomycetota bacterium]
MPKLDDKKFGPNLWLMQEMHERYLQHPESVSEAWREFFEDYYPGEHRLRPPAPLVPESFGDGPPQPADQRPAEAPPASDLGVPASELEPRSTDGAAGTPLSRADAVLATRMEESLSVPTATSVRTIPAKLLEVNRNILNNHQTRSRSKKVSFTHLIGWAVVRAVTKMPGMNTSFGERDGRPVAVHHPQLNLGLAVDIKQDDGSRTLWVPNVKDAGRLTFAQFFAAYEDLMRKVRSRRMTPADMEGTTVTLTNPGMLGTAQSVPRLMEGQAAIVGVGSIAFPAEYQGADPTMLADLGIGKVVTLTSTYDHRVIQGALSGEFLAEIERLLLGEYGFYEEIFLSMGVPYVPVKWRIDRNPARSTLEADVKQARVLQLINIYRVRGHLIADLDPLDTEPPKLPSELDPATYGFTIWDLDRRFPTGSLANVTEQNRRASDAGRPETLGRILQILRDAYCRTVGVEYMHISAVEEKRWIQQRIEGVDIQLEARDHDRILAKLNEAEAFETFLHTKYVGHKRFSLEGALSLIPMLDAVLDSATGVPLEEAVIGMAHRGRLNVLANIIGKSYTQIFKEFEGDIDPETVHGSGDVKYHIGASGRYVNPQGVSIPVSVVSNPSHLESVDPVVEGVVRAKQDALNRPDDFPVLPILIHGDAAFAGQGVVAETLNLSQLRGYRTGGTVHIIVNNQVGFTATAGETRSSTYASDVAEMIQAPIFHVNGDDPEACLRVARLAFDYRQAFHKDVVIDMWCYRKLGHNEADEPSYTQPLMYKRIAARRSVRKLYTESLLYRNHLTLEAAEQALQDFQSKLQGAFNAMHEQDGDPRLNPPTVEETAARPQNVGLATLSRVLETISDVPPAFALHPKLAKLLEARRRSLVNDHVDWPVAEALAFGSMLAGGMTIRMAGQDSRRGTFSQRHAVLIDQETGVEYTPLSYAARDGAKFLIYDSMLSEFAALGFEYGYSTVAEDTLTIWEAQFGDFANGAQVVIDQFIAAGEDKWGQTSNLVMLLPHGYEGQGPEHSSARLERYLTLGADDNYRVTVPSTAAQYFHLLLDQGLPARRKPLVVLTPKSLLRLPAAASGVIDLISGGWMPVLSDPSRPSSDAVRRLILCSGKVYYDLAAARERQGIEGLALVRVEQLYPFPAEQIAEELARYDAAEVLWVQEEPENMGAWRYMQNRFSDEFKVPLLRQTRRASASPAAGSARKHEREQELLINAALAGLAD